MSWKRGDSKSPKDEKSKKDGDSTKTGEESTVCEEDILEINASEFLDEEALLQGGSEDDDSDEGTNDDLLEGDVIGETSSAGQNDAVEVADVGQCKSYALPGTVPELSVSAGQVDNDKAKIEQGQPDGSGKRKGALYCEDKSSATLSAGPKSGDSVATAGATTYAEPASRKQGTTAKKSSALESSVLASNQPGQSSHGNARHVTSDKGETSGSAGRDISPSRSGTAARGGRLSKRTDHAYRVALCSNGPQQSRRDSRFTQRGPYSRGHNASHGKQRHMPYTVRPSTGISSPSRPPFRTSQPCWRAPFGPPDAEQPHVAFPSRSPFRTSPPTNRPAASGNLSQANLQDLLHVLVGTAVSAAKRTSEMPAIETLSTLVGPVSANTDLDHRSPGSCSPGIAGLPLQPLPSSHQRWPLPGDRAVVQNSSYEVTSQLHVDSKEAAVRRGAATGDTGNSLPKFGHQHPSHVSNEAAKRPAYLDNKDMSHRRLPSCEPPYNGASHRRLPSCEPPYNGAVSSSETLQKSASKSTVGHSETSKDIFPASKNFPSSNYAPRAPSVVEVPKMHIDYNHGNGDCDYRIPEHLRKTAEAIGVDRRADLAEPSDREEWTSAAQGKLSQDGNTNDCRRLERCDAGNAGSKRPNPSSTRTRSTISGTQSLDDPSSTYGDVKRTRIDGTNVATSLHSPATSAPRNVATDQSPTQVARFSKNSASNQASLLTETFSDDAPIKRSPNSDEYDKRLQEQLLLRKEIMRRKEEQRRQEAERRRIEVEKSRENSDSSTPYAAVRRNPDDGTANAGGSIAVAVATRQPNFGRETEFIRQPTTPVGTANSRNRLLRERYRYLQLVANQGKPVSKAALSTSSLSVRGITGSSTHRKSKALDSGIRSVSDGGNAGERETGRAPPVPPGNSKQFGAGEPMTPRSEPATFWSPAGHGREDLRAWPQPQWPQQQERHTAAVDSRSPNQSGWLRVDYDRDSTENRHAAGLSSRGSKKVRIHNVSPSASIPLSFAAARCGKVVDMHFDGIRSAIVEFDTECAAESFFKHYNNFLLDNANISVSLEIS